jgi:hypothetical protein
MAASLSGQSFSKSALMSLEFDTADWAVDVAIEARYNYECNLPKLQEEGMHYNGSDAMNGAFWASGGDAYSQKDSTYQSFSSWSDNNLGLPDTTSSTWIERQVGCNFLHEGSSFSCLVNQIPGMNCVAYYHDFLSTTLAFPDEAYICNISEPITSLGTTVPCALYAYGRLYRQSVSTWSLGR